MNEQNSNPEQAAALTKEAEENHVQVIQVLRELKPKKKAILEQIREVRKDLRRTKKLKRNERCYLKHLKWNLASVNDDIQLAKEIIMDAGYDPEKAYVATMTATVTAEGAAQDPKSEMGAIDDDRVMQSTEPDFTDVIGMPLSAYKELKEEHEEPKSYPHLRLERCNVDDPGEPEQQPPLPPPSR